MKRANEYKAWYRNNDPQNARKDFKEYNRSFGEYYKRPPEYSESPDEYHKFPERYDYIEDQDRQKESKDNQNNQNQQNSSSMRAQAVGKSVVKSVVGNAVALVVGAVVLVAGYNAIKAKKAEAEIVHTFTPTWIWADDHKTATLSLISEDSSIKLEFPVESTLTEEVLATCTVDGYRLYNVSFDYNDTNYTDSYSEVLHAEHKFDDGTIVGGNIEYTCSECGEHLIIHIDIEEND